MAETLRALRLQIARRAVDQALADLNLAAETLKELRDAAVPNTPEKGVFRAAAEQADLLAVDAKALARRLPGLPSGR